MSTRIALILSLFALFFSNTAFASDNKITVGTVERPPFVFHGKNGELTGFSVELWEQIARKANLEFQWREHDQFSSMLDDTVQGIDNLAIANISVTSERERLGDFSQPIFESGMAIAIKRGTSTSLFTLIWESGILLFLGGAALILLVIAHVIWFFELNVADARHDYFRDDYLGGVWDAFWWAFIIMTMGGFEKEVPHKKISRVIAMFWIIVSLFFISTLTAKITTALTVAELTSDIEDYRDLSGKRVGVTKGSSHEKFLDSKNIRSIGYKNLNDLYADLQSEQLDAIVSDLPILSYYASNEGVAWMQLAGEPFNLDNFAIYFPDNSPLYEQVNAALLQLREEDVYSTLHDKYFRHD